jgi:hypothetical protein
MEGLMKKIFILLFSLFALNISVAAESSALKKNLIGIKYFSQTMGNVHQNPSRYSQVPTVSCNHPVKIMKEISKDGKEFVLFGEDKWNLVSVGPYEGYLMASFLSDTKNECIEEEYSKFFDGLGLDINDLYYLARLNDHYIQGKSKVRQ